MIAGTSNNSFVLWMRVDRWSNDYGCSTGDSLLRSHGPSGTGWREFDISHAITSSQPTTSA